MENICMFCGHRRNIPQYVCNGLLYQIEKLYYQNNVTVFLNGGMGEFDNMARLAVRALQAHRLKIKIMLVMPYLTHDFYNNSDKYKDAYDEIIVPDLGYVHYKSAIPARNRWMVNKSQYMISYVSNNYGGAYATYKYATERNISIIDI